MQEASDEYGPLEEKSKSKTCQALADFGESFGIEDNIQEWQKYVLAFGT